MKYYELKLNSDVYTNAPQLINWYGIQDVRLIRWETYHKLQNRLVYNVGSTETITATDIISSPFLLVSSMVKDTINLYGDAVVFKEIILINDCNTFSELYYMPIMEENSEITMAYRKQSGHNKRYKNDLAWIEERSIFWIKHKNSRATIINLDLAESLLRRNAVGLHLEEVILSGPET